MQKTKQILNVVSDIQQSISDDIPDDIFIINDIALLCDIIYDKDIQLNDNCIDILDVCDAALLIAHNSNNNSNDKLFISTIKKIINKFKRG